MRCIGGTATARAEITGSSGTDIAYGGRGRDLSRLVGSPLCACYVRPHYVMYCTHVCHASGAGRLKMTMLRLRLSAAKDDKEKRGRGQGGYSRSSSSRGGEGGSGRGQGRTRRRGKSAQDKEKGQDRGGRRGERDRGGLHTTAEAYQFKTWPLKKDRRG
eukprot:3934847-Rhodomonas_salina.1